VSRQRDQRDERVCVRSYEKSVNGRRLGGESEVEGRGGNFGPRGPATRPCLLFVPLVRRATNTSGTKILRPKLALPPCDPSALPSSPVSRSASPSLARSLARSSAARRAHSGKGFCIATGPGNISFRKITGSRRGCQCIKQTSLRQPYT